MKNIAILIPNFGRGGAETFAIELAHSLSSKYNCTILCSSIGENSYPTQHVNSREIGDILYDPEKLCSFLSSLDIDLVWSHMSWDNFHVQCLPLIKQNGFKVILTEHSSFWYPYFCSGIGLWDPPGRLKAEIMSSLQLLDAVICVSEDTFSEYKRHFDKVYYVPNYPSQHYIVDSIKKEKHTATRIGNVSSFAKPVKRLDLLYHAYSLVIKDNPKTELHIAGKSNYFKDYCYRRPIREYGLDSKIVLHDEIEDVKTFYESIDIFCLTSQLEGMPTVVLESAMMGIPTVSFDIPGIRTILKHELTGFIVPFGDVEQMAFYLNKLAISPDLRHELGINAKSFVSEEFSINRSSKEYINIIDEVLSRPTEQQSSSLEGCGFWELDKEAQRRKADFLDRVSPCKIEGFIPDCIRGEWGLQPFISFLIPAYNSIGTIEKAISSINHHYSFNWECIVLDDGSTDNVYDLINENYGHLSHIKVVQHEQNQGLYAARSTLGKHAQGEYIVFLDADDTIDISNLEKLLTIAVDRDVDILDTGLNELDGSGVMISHYKPVDLDDYPNQTISKSLTRSFFYRNRIKHSCCGKIYKASAFKASLKHEVPSGKINLCEDLLRNTIVFSEGITYSSVSRFSFYNYIRHSSTMTKGLSSFAHISSKLRQLEPIYMYCSERAHSAGFLQEARYLKSRLIEDYYWMVEQYIHSSLEHGRTFSELLQESLIPDYLPEIITSIAEDEDFKDLPAKLLGHAFVRIGRTPSSTQ